ncbi:similar to Saccharomyces cerevisiae YMR227C TAF7 TFIID subunit (67 kDa), involved in RNA polymerase II transcription initiation [Maudiozyma saulgeensis]|uniref:Similar to Saccharomyces cerevisiae YMR227C TAF7 TFIID subunit (67 kDa), involved in RNA polymerase II transcription initiation n=1 Tax=Maudiozyma saulgeensis TaxID=1789683 RepID=A0A1X7R8Z2_9SACH|nr:similar to Saccharomyces cerevisiae YMR227C TAF7 TFIID subunit (67 kDa), involved in RNA polymerase II transcription initiation [Kazachstania saulgeensis]
MAIIKIKKPRDPNQIDVDEPKVKKIRIKTKSNDRKAGSPAVGTPKIKINLRSNEKPSTGIKVKLNLKKGNNENSTEKPKLKAPRLRLKPIRVPGDGYDSEASDIEDDPLIESGIILRVQPDIQIEFIRNSIESGDYSGISIKWKADRHAVVSINDVMYGAILVDLPTIVEVNKSVDRKNLLKTIDVDQMLLCVQVIEKEDDVFLLEPPNTEDIISKHFEGIQDEINENKKMFFKSQHGNQLSEVEQKFIQQITQKKYDYTSGLTPPLYNVRNRRFRRKMAPVELEYVDRTVEMLLKQDEGSEEVNYELIDPSQILPKTTSSMTLVADMETAELVGNSPTGLGGDEEDELDLDAAFQSDEEEISGQAHKIDDVLEGDAQQYSDAEIDNDVEDEDDDDEEEEEDDDDEDDTGEKDESRQHAKLLEDELRELESTLSHTKKKSQKVTNPLLKSRFLDSIKKLEKEVELKKKQLKVNEESIKGPEAREEDNNEEINVNNEEDLDDEDEDDDNDEELDDDQEEEEVDEEVQEDAAEQIDDDKLGNEDEIIDKEDNQEAAVDNQDEFDQNDLDMMMLFGAEGDEADDD